MLDFDDVEEQVQFEQVEAAMVDLMKKKIVDRDDIDSHGKATLIATLMAFATVQTQLILLGKQVEALQEIEGSIEQVMELMSLLQQAAQGAKMTKKLDAELEALGFVWE